MCLCLLFFSHEAERFILSPLSLTPHLILESRISESPLDHWSATTLLDITRLNMSDSAANVAQVDTNNNNDDAAPRRYIYNQVDMEHFRHSPARKELLSFVTAMGRGLTTTTTNGSNAASESATKFITTRWIPLT